MSNSKSITFLKRGHCGLRPKNRIDEAAGKYEHGSVTNPAACLLRENTGTSGLVASARAAVALLRNTTFRISSSADSRCRNTATRA
jgi:hypothetical protein